MFEARLDFEALQDGLTGMCFHQEVVNMPGMKTSQARSPFGQDGVITSPRSQWDNAWQNVIKALFRVWEVSRFHVKLTHAYGLLETVPEFWPA